MANSSFLASLAVLTVTYLIHSTLLLAGVWLALKVCGVRSHALAERAWKLAALLGLATGTLQLAAGVSQPLAVFVLEPSHRSVTARHADPLTAEPPAPIAAPTGVWRLVDGKADRLLRQPEASKAEPSVRLSAAADGEQVSAGSRPAPNVSSTLVAQVGHATLAGMLFAAWIVLAAAWLAVKAWQHHRILAKSRTMSAGRARQALDRFRHRHGMRREVRLLISQACSTPLACGLLRWTIVLPEGAEERMRNDELEALFAHELAHLARGDMFWLWIGQLLTSCLAFQPLNRLAVRSWQREAEYLCDDWAVERLVDPLALARCLTNVAGWSASRRQIAAALAMAGRANTLVPRVERLVAGAACADRWSTARRRRSLAVAAVLAGLVFAYWAPRASSSPLAAATNEAQSLQLTKTSVAVPPPGATQRRARGKPTDWQMLQAEWNELHRDWKRAETLLAPLEGQAEIRHAADRIRDRAAAIDGRVNALIQSFEAERSFKEE
ncbi:MAG TPA: M56 family metallopeptidase [Pirellulales bacterium]|nr:M56 family metallopeptidase [Pirellulales bacterium]